MAGIVRVGALVLAPTPEEYREQLRRWSVEAASEGDADGTMTAEEIDTEVGSRQGALDLQVELFAVLPDRRVVTDESHGTMGVSMTGGAVAVLEGYEGPVPRPYDHLTPELVERDVREDLFMEGESPDDRWSRLVVALGELGIHTSAEELDALPFSMELTEAVRKRLRQLRGE